VRAEPEPAAPGEGDQHDQLRDHAIMVTQGCKKP
jgi:hypothetical protein